MKRLIALLLCFALLAGSGTIAFAAEEAVTGTDIPTVYVSGTGSGLVVHEPDGTDRRVYGIDLPDDFIAKTVKENLNVFKRAFFTQKWDEFCKVARDIFVPIFQEIRLDENGEAPNGSVVRWDWNIEELESEKVNGKYPTDRYWFTYDWRMDPYKTAEILHDYVEDVLEVTGETKINLVGRCLGASITAAYMEKYDGQYVEECLFYAGAMCGATQCSKAFCGELFLEGDGIERYLYDLKLFADDTLNDLVQSFATLLGKTYGLDIASWAVNNVYEKIYLDIVPPIVIDTYGSFPGYWAMCEDKYYWSMVADRDYEKAKQTVFYGADMEKYANFIRIIDNYHYNVQTKLPELFEHFREKGIGIANIVKYGFQGVPVTRNSDMLSDQVCGVEDASFGATTSTILGTLSDDYLKTADMRYVSPDRQIDASTCLLPDRTWFIKNLEHTEFPECVERLFDFILNEKATVFDSETFPQYLVYDPQTETIFPQTTENCNTLTRYRQTFFDALLRFWKSLFKLIRNWIKSKIAK